MKVNVVGTQDWFEMRHLRRRLLDESVWIPLRASQYPVSEGRPGYEGFVEEFFGANTLMVPTGSVEAAEELEWTSIGIATTHRGRVDDDGDYSPSDIYKDWEGRFSGLFPVLVVEGNSDELPEWHLHQDLVATLRLKREGNVWLAIDEGYEEVARLTVAEDGAPVLLEFRANYLKDYLCARSMALRSVVYRSRVTVVAQTPTLPWPGGQHSETTDLDIWEGRVLEIHEGGMPFGEKVAVFHWFREDFDDDQDVPKLQAPHHDDSITSRSWEVADGGSLLYRVSGELWRNEWVEPGTASPRVREDKLPATAFFIVDAAGTKLGKDALVKTGRWLWFKPEVISSLSHRRGGSLTWYTAETGGVACSPDYPVHFGVNQLGLVTVYSKDIGRLPDWQQHAWASFNIAPEGRVSAELLDSQVRAEPAATVAPEGQLASRLESMDRAFEAHLGFKLFREHEAVPELLRKAHRFRATDEAGLLALAKDLNRLVTERIDSTSLRDAQKLPKDSKLGSIKLLEALLTTKLPLEDARELTAPAVGVYDLRHGDSHLPGSALSDAYALLGLDQSLPFILQGFHLVRAMVNCLEAIENAVVKHFSLTVP